MKRTLIVYLAALSLCSYLFGEYTAKEMNRLGNERSYSKQRSFSEVLDALKRQQGVELSEDPFDRPWEPLPISEQSATESEASPTRSPEVTPSEAPAELPEMLEVTAKEEAEAVDLYRKPVVREEKYEPVDSLEQRLDRQSKAPSPRSNREVEIEMESGSVPSDVFVLPDEEEKNEVDEARRWEMEKKAKAEEAQQKIEAEQLKKVEMEKEKEAKLKAERERLAKEEEEARQKEMEQRRAEAQAQKKAEEEKVAAQKKAQELKKEEAKAKAKAKRDAAQLKKAEAKAKREAKERKKAEALAQKKAEVKAKVEAEKKARQKGETEAKLEAESDKKPVEKAQKKNFFEKVHDTLQKLTIDRSTPREENTQIQNPPKKMAPADPDKVRRYKSPPSSEGKKNIFERVFKFTEPEKAVESPSEEAKTTSEQAETDESSSSDELKGPRPGAERRSEDEISTSPIRRLIF